MFLKINEAKYKKIDVMKMYNLNELNLLKYRLFLTAKLSL